MRGRREFTQHEADRIRELLRKKVRADREEQKKIRRRIRGIGFYISDFDGTFSGFGVNDFEQLVAAGEVSISLRNFAAEEQRRRTPAAYQHQRRDEDYVIDLCDEILGESAIRQHRFDFLRGDANTRLPVDAYYPSRKLVVEYRERQHTQSVRHFDKPDRMTVSGVHRGDQRRLYDQRRRDVLPRHGIRLVEIEFSSLKHRSNGRLVRDRVADYAVIKGILHNLLIPPNG